MSAGGKKTRRIPPAEWAVAILGAALTLGAIGYLTVAALGGPTRPPDIAVKIVGVERLSSGWLVRIRATNRGDEAAADVTIEGVARRDARGEERSSVTLDYLPARSDRTGGLFFTIDPRREPVELRAGGFRTP